MFSFSIDANVPVLTWKADPTWQFDNNQLSTGDAAKLKSAYACKGNDGNSCYMHIRNESGWKEFCKIKALQYCVLFLRDSELRAAWRGLHRSVDFNHRTRQDQDKVLECKAVLH